MSFPHSCSCNLLAAAGVHEAKLSVIPSIVGVGLVAASAVVLVLVMARSRRAVTGLLLAGAAALLAVWATGFSFHGSASESYSAPGPVEKEFESADADEAINQPLESEAPARASTKPDWVGKPDMPLETGYAHAIQAGPYPSEPEAYKHLLIEAEKYTRDYYIQREFGAEAADKIIIDRDYLQREILKKPTWAAPSKHEFEGEMEDWITLHGRLEYTSNTRAYFAKQWAEVMAQRNLWGICIVATSVLALIGTLLGYFRLDTATKGYYTTRLKLAATGCAATVCGGAYYLAGYVLRLF